MSLALVWAIAVGVFFAFAPVSSSTTVSSLPDGASITVTSSDSLVGSEGSSVLAPLAVPIALTAIAVLAGRSRTRRTVRLWTGALLLLACLVAAASIGLPYLPAALLLILAGIKTPASALEESASSV